MTCNKFIFEFKKFYIYIYIYVHIYIHYIHRYVIIYIYIYIYTLHRQICHLFSYLVVLASINKYMNVQLYGFSRTLSSALRLINFQISTFYVLFILHYYLDDIYKYIYNHCQCLNTFRYILILSSPTTFSYKTKYKSSHTVFQEGKSKNSTHFH